MTEPLPPPIAGAGEDQDKLATNYIPVPSKSNTRGASQKPTDLPIGTQLGADPSSSQFKAKPIEPGDHVNHYELIRLLGKGGMGSVFLARDNKLGRRVAIKFLHTEDADLTKRFILEARTTARFSHENIVTIFEVDEHHGQPYMVLEFLQGQPLTKLLGEGGKPMPPQRAVELMFPVVRALASAHAQGIVHRDLKFDNVLVTESGTIKVLDFGIAKVLQGDGAEKEPAAPAKPTAHDKTSVGKAPKDGVELTDLTQHGTIMGTLAFMSPEQWKAGAIDHRTDIWAAGIMLYRMMAGRHPLYPLTGMALSVTGRLDEPMPKLKSVVHDIPSELADAVDRCLMKPRDERWPDANALMQTLEKFLPGRYTRELKIDESPYAGLSSFQESDADRFFGRDHEIASLVNRIRDVPLVGVVGPSGTGKSSFVRAGLVPALKRGGEAWESIVLRPGRNPLASLADILTPLLGSSVNVADDLKEQNAMVEKVRREPGYVGSVLRSRARREKRNILVFIDQFEELYTMVPNVEDRMAFTACLASIADDATSPTRVILSIRSDFLDRVPEDEVFMNELTKGLFFLTSPAEAGLRSALVQPAEMAGYRFENDDIVNDMLGHLASTQGALPLLQFAATKLWESRDATRKMLTTASYTALGGVAGALAVHADAVLNELPGPARALAKSVFLRLVTPERTRAIVSIEELRELSKDTAEVQRLIDQLVQARLLVVQTAGNGTATAEIVHESLVGSWPTLRRWLDESGEDAAFLEQLRTAAKQWQQKGKDAGLLWRGDAAEEAHRFQRRFKGELPAIQREFIDQVFAQEVRSARRKRLLGVAGVAVLALGLLGAVVSLIKIAGANQIAEEKAQLAVKAEGEAKKEAVAARQAQDEAQKNLEEVRKKEVERAAAEKAADEARQKAEASAKEAQAAAAQLAVALQQATEAQHQSVTARARAEANAKLALAAEQVAKEKSEQAQQLAAQESERARRLQAQLGSAAIDTLK